MNWKQLYHTLISQKIQQQQQQKNISLKNSQKDEMTENNYIFPPAPKNILISMYKLRTIFHFTRKYYCNGFR